jgi:hypothetical protein
MRWRLVFWRVLFAAGLTVCGGCDDLVHITVGSGFGPYSVRVTAPDGTQVAVDLDSNNMAVVEVQSGSKVSVSYSTMSSPSAYSQSSKSVVGVEPGDYLSFYVDPRIHDDCSCRRVGLLEDELGVYWIDPDAADVDARVIYSTSGMFPGIVGSSQSHDGFTSTQLPGTRLGNNLSVTVIKCDHHDWDDLRGHVANGVCR